MRTPASATCLLGLGIFAALQLPAQETPPARAFSASAYDTDRRVLVVFGGVSGESNNPAVLAETWEFDGRAWRRVSSPQSPPPRYLHAMAYDASQRRVVLFGGLNDVRQPEPLGDTWLWDGRTWTRGPDGPPARMGHSLTFDPARPRAVLSGGMYRGEVILTDEWELVAGAWRQLRGPTPGALAAQVDSARDRALADSRSRSFRAALRSDLRNLVVAQESYFADNYRYASTLEALRFQASTGVTIRLVTTTPNAWSAIATHREAPGGQCGIFVGNAPPPLAAARDEGEPGCAGFPGDPPR